MEAFRPEEL
jgi:hypothetical protein